MECQHVVSLPLLSIVVNGCERKPANPCIDPSVVTQNGRQSYCGVRSNGSSDSRHFSVTNAFCWSEPHLFFSDVEASALL
jgi:hypothetical protein